jgi:hypothetical protein
MGSNSPSQWLTPRSNYAALEVQQETNFDCRHEIMPVRSQPGFDSAVNQRDKRNKSKQCAEVINTFADPKSTAISSGTRGPNANWAGDIYDLQRVVFREPEADVSAMYLATEMG